MEGHAAHTPEKHAAMSHGEHDLAAEPDMHAGHDVHTGHDMHAGHDMPAMAAGQNVHGGHDLAGAGGHAAHADHSGHEQMFRRRFWISLLLSIPVLLYSDTLQALLHFSMPAFPGSG